VTRDPSGVLPGSGVFPDLENSHVQATHRTVWRAIPLDNPYYSHSIGWYVQLRRDDGSWGDPYWSEYRGVTPDTTDDHLWEAIRALYLAWRRVSDHMVEHLVLIIARELDG